MISMRVLLISTCVILLCLSRPLSAQAQFGPTCTYTGTLTVSGRAEVSVYHLATPGRGPLTILPGGSVTPALLAIYQNAQVSFRGRIMRENGATVGLSVKELFQAPQYAGGQEESIATGCLQDLLENTPAPVYPARATAISADGKVIVGGYEGARAFKYENGHFTPLATVSGRQSTALAVSADGSVIVGVSDTDSSPRAFRYTNGTVTDLGVLPRFTRCNAAGVSSDGAQIVGSCDLLMGGNIVSKQSWRYVNGTMQGILPYNLEASGVSPDGSTVYGRFYTRDQDYTDSFIGFFYRNTTYTQLSDFDRAVAASRDGSVLVGSSSQFTNRYQGGQATSLGKFFPTAITPDGGTVVGFSNRSDPVKVSASRLYSLGLLGCRKENARSNRCDQSTTVAQATGISSDGKRIVGYSSTSDGTIHPFLYVEE